jgi:transposase InsO family protein
LLAKHRFICSNEQRQGQLLQTTPSWESFYHTLKIELVYVPRYRLRNKAQTAVFDYIEIFYNRQRLHSSLDYQTSEVFERGG